ncbi:ABC transporter permease [Streptococcus zalophi]|uniref:ABC transporter permease n=1 Tax=Streptococcus zalophi TaxID=640031 RepID=UPI00215C2CC1|nr:ABC transporter permease [Streptococcus zalophi]MCR8967381.1 ABC transporter permease [Streptococcus zalophi]
MNWSNIWELIKVNILYTNPQAATALRNKQKKNPHKKIAVYKKMMQQQLLGTIFFTAILFYLFAGIDYTKQTGLFSFQVATFSLITAIYAFSTFFSVFYDSKDSQLYLALPLKSEEVYLAKLLSSQGISLMFLMPVFILFCIAFVQQTQSLLGILLAIILILILVLLVNAIGLILVNVIGNILVKSPYKKIISTTIMIVSTLLSVGMIIFVQNVSVHISIEDNSFSMPIIPYFRGFYDVVVNPFSIDSLLNFWLGLALLSGLLIYIQKNVVPNYINQLKSIDSQKTSRIIKRKTTTTTDTNKLLLKHHLSTINNGTLIVQSFIMPMMMTISFLGPIFNSHNTNVSNFDSSYFGVAFLIGTVFGSIMSSPSSFLGVALSLERENFNFIKTLPVNFSHFIKQKFQSLFFIQLSLPILIYTVISFFFLEIPIILFLSFMIGLLLSSFVFSEWMYQRDYKLLTLNWQNITQLFSRGKGNFLTAGLIFGNMIIGMILISASLIVSTVLSPLAVSIIDIIIMNLLLLLLHLRIKKRFWNQLP